MSMLIAKPKADGTQRRRIAVVTGTRAEFGLLEPVLRALAERRRLEARLIVTGMHLLPRFGRTIDHIRRAGWRIDAVVRMQRGRASAADEPAALARGIAGIARALSRMNCGVVLVLGDRLEALAGACAAVLGRRVLVHIHGGDRAIGDVDDTLRNAITRLAHIHLVASTQAGRRLRRMGEESWRIRCVGAPGLDDIRRFRDADARSPQATDRRLRELLGSPADRPYALVVQHPCGRSDRREETVMRRIIAAVERCRLAGVALYPNSDPGHDGIIRAIRTLRDRTHWRVFRSLPRDDYLRVASRAAVMVGNSSSGIIESASLGVRVVNVGPRQEGRLRCAPSVVDAAETTDAIARAIRRAVRQPRPRPAKSAYGDGRAAVRMADVLERLITSPLLSRKGLAY